MIGLDTNVVIRYLAQDEAKQAAAATRLIEDVLGVENPGFVSLVTLCEVAWVLAACYDADEARIRAVIEALLASKQLAVQEPDVVWAALRDWKGSTADFSDALLGAVARAHGCSTIMTFDKGASRLPSLQLLT